MVLVLTNCQLPIVATYACALHFCVIHIHRQEGNVAMAGAALVTGGDMVQRLTCCTDVVMTGDTVITHLVVIEPRRLPAKIGVAIRTLIVHRNMGGRFTRYGDVVVAIFATAEDFVVIDDRYRLPGNGAVAGVATLTGKDVINRFGGGVETAVDAVASSTFPRRSGELSVDVTAFAGHKIVTAGEFKPGSGVIERLVLGQRRSGITQKHRQTKNPQTPLHCSHHGLVLQYQLEKLVLAMATAAVFAEATVVNILAFMTCTTDGRGLVRIGSRSMTGITGEALV